MDEILRNIHFLKLYKALYNVLAKGSFPVEKLLAINYSLIKQKAPWKKEITFRAAHKE